ncbi:PAS domain S-box protein [Patescibacteria group bacterium]|nr:PAS domain S-box protein [Patescibacteria group bacterium]
MNRNVHKDGREIWFSTSGIPILNEKGNLLGYRGADADITERKQAEEREKQSAVELKNALDMAEKTIKLMVGRELEMIELKKEIEELRKNRTI